MRLSLITLSVILFLFASSASLIADEQDSDSPKTGMYFEVTIESAGNPPVTWKNWRDSGYYYGEANIESNRTVIIIRDGFSYSLSPDIKVVRKSRIVTDPEKNLMASRYGPLADIAQLNPETYSDLIVKLGGQSLGPALTDNKPSELFTVNIPDNINFPWRNFSIALDRENKLPLQIKYTENNQQRTLKFNNIRTSIDIESGRFDIPEDYKVISFEWD